MKTYICLNTIECTWADETPPREFTLPNGDENTCPNCGSTTIREVVPASPPWKRIIPFVVGGMIVLGLLLYFILGDDTKTDTREKALPPKDTTTISVTGPSNASVNQEGKSKDHSSHKSAKITYRKVEGSEFCISECVLGYSEIDNLGRVREKRVENYAKCCPANK